VGPPGGLRGRKYKRPRGTRLAFQHALIPPSPKLREPVPTVYVSYEGIRKILFL